MTIKQAKKFNTWALRGDTDVDWYESYANRLIFELCDAAYILADVQPEYPGPLDAVSNAAISQWIETLKANVHELLAFSGYNEKEPLHHRLSHQKLRAWCMETGTSWPIPESAAVRIKAVEQQLEDERKLRLKAQHLAEPTMSLFVRDNTPSSSTTLQLGHPEEVYRHLDYLSEVQALDWMSRIAGHQVEWDTFWGMISFDMCDVFMDCRAVPGLAYAAEGEYEHRKVFGLGICQVMNAVRPKGVPLHLQGPAIHVDMYGFQEIVTKRAWWIDNLADYDLLFRPSDIEKIGGMVNKNGGWSNDKQIEELELNPLKEFAPERSGAELSLLLSNLEIGIDNQSDEGFHYSIRFDGGRLLAVLGSDLKPVKVAVNQPPKDHADYNIDRNNSMINDASIYETELTRLRDLLAEQSESLAILQTKASPFPDQATTGIAFPYATKELEVMKAVATEHWAGLNPQHRQPKQEFIQDEIRKKLGMSLGKNDAMPNKAVYLATAIRPDGATRA